MSYNLCLKQLNYAKQALNIQRLMMRPTNLCVCLNLGKCRGCFIDLSNQIPNIFSYFINKWPHISPSDYLKAGTWRKEIKE